MKDAPRLRILMRAGHDGAARVAAALEAAGNEVIVVDGDAELAARLKDAPPDLVVLDAVGEAALDLVETRQENGRLREAVSYARTTAHDLAQPLTTILARSQLLLSKAGPDDPSHKPLKVISDEATRLADLIVKFQKLKEMSK